MIRDPQQLLRDLEAVAELAGMPLQPGTLEYEWLPAPHRQPACLPRGKMAVYAFFFGERCLKVGKAGRKSAARFTSQHYLPESCNSNLAKSLVLRAEACRAPVLQSDTVGSWIKQNTARFHLLMPAEHPIRLLTLSEVFLQCRFLPVYEGFKTQE